jgi:predicted acylesterase/phospholipase RssA
MHTLMERLFQRHGVVRLVDGGIVNNVPSRIAWQHVQRGDIGTRNAFILAMDCFAPQLTRNVLMHPVQRLVRPQVNANAVFAGFTKTFAQVLSPLDVVPDFKKIQVAMRNGYRELDHDRRFIAAMMRPVGPLSP